MRVPILPPPGLVSDDTEYSAPGVWRDGSNVRFYHGLPQSIGGETTLQSAAAETYTNVGKMFAYKVSGVVNIAVGGNSLYRVDTTTWARTDITPASGWVVAFGRSFAMFGDVLLAVPHSTTPSLSGTLFQSTGGAQAVSVANAPDTINAMLVTPSRQVMALGCNEEVSTTFNGRCIRWSDIEDYTDWTTSSSNNAGEYILPGQDDIVGGRIVGDFIAVWTRGALFLGQYVGQPGQTFVFTRIDGTGLIGRDCHAEFQGTVYWMAPDLVVWAWRPGSVPEKIECPCQVDVWSDIRIDLDFPTAEQRVKFHAFINRRYGEVWFCFPQGSAASPNAYLAYCIKESEAAQKHVWFRGSMLAGSVIDDPLLADALNMADTTIVRIEYGSTKALTAIDRVYGGTVPAWNIQSSFYYLDEGQRRVQIQRYINDADGNTVEHKMSVFVQDYPKSSSVTSGPHTILTLTNTKKVDFRKSGRLVRVKYENSTAPGWWRLGKPAFEVVAMGER